MTAKKVKKAKKAQRPLAVRAVDAPFAPGDTQAEATVLLTLREEPEGHLVLFLETEALGLLVPYRNETDEEKLAAVLTARASDIARLLLDELDT